jgi:SAM-dependent methyltransferase
LDEKMSVVCATTWYPRGELPRLAHYLPVLEEHYARLVICFIPSGDPSVQEQFTSGQFSGDPQVMFCLNDQRRNGRYMALKAALENPGEFIHYVDLDRLLHWVETRREEWLSMLDRLQQADYTIFGRTEAATRTHPQALITTEVLSNRVVSHFMGKEMDVSAGSKAFSRAAAQYLVRQGNPDNSIGTDAEWPILLKRAGFSMQYILVDGLDYESGDQYLTHAASPEEQRQAAARYDAEPAHWITRVDIADQIIQTALQVSRHTAMTEAMETEKDHFDPQPVFEVDDYLYFYRESLTDERTDAEVSALVSLLELSHPMHILDLACGFGRHTNRLAALGHSLIGIDLTPGFLDIARHDALERGVQVTYQRGDMREITFDNEFDRVMLLFTAFGYFSDDVNLQVLVKMAKALKPGGLLIFDSHNRDGLLKDMRPYYVVEKEGNLMIDRLSFDGLTGRWHNRRIVFRNGIRKDKPFFVRLYNPCEIQALLKQAGLEFYHLYAGLDGKEFTADAHRMVVVARKPL